MSIENAAAFAVRIDEDRPLRERIHAEVAGKDETASVRTVVEIARREGFDFTESEARLLRDETMRPPLKEDDLELVAGGVGQTAPPAPVSPTRDVNGNRLPPPDPQLQKTDPNFRGW